MSANMFFVKYHIDEVTAQKFRKAANLYRRYTYGENVYGKLCDILETIDEDLFYTYLGLVTTR